MILVSAGKRRNWNLRRSGPIVSNEGRASGLMGLKRLAGRLLPGTRLARWLPSPVMPDTVTVRVVPLPLTASEPLAVPVLLRVMLPAAKVLELKFASA